MDLVFTIYSFLFLVATILSFFVAYHSWQRRSVKAARELAFLMCATGLWTFWIILETAAQTVPLKLFWSKLEYLGAVSSPVLYLIFVLRFVGRDKFLTKKNVILLFILPFTTLLLALTNEMHHLIWSGFSAISPKTNIMQYFHGIGFWIGYLAYNYLLIILATIYLFTFIVQRNKTFSLQGVIILIASLCPWVASVIYLVGWNVVPGLDLTPVSMVVSSLLMAYAIYYTRLLDLVPIARETLLEIMSDGIIVLDDQNRVQDINPAAIEFLGIDNKEILGLHVGTCVTVMVDLLNAVIQQEPVEQIEVKVGGTLRIFSLVKKSIKSQHGSRLIVIRDITEQISHQFELLNAESRYRQMFASNPQPMWIFDSKTFDFLEVNQAAILLYGYTREEFLRLSLKDICLDLPDGTQNSNSDCTGESERRHLTKNGEEIIVEEISNTIYFEGRKGCHALILNITERKKGEIEMKHKNEQLAKAYAEKDRFFSIIAHDLRSPFSAFLGLTEIMADELSTLSMVEIQSFAESLRSSASSLFLLLENLLNWARSQQGLIVFNKLKINLLSSVNESSAIFSQAAFSKGINIRYDFPDNLTLYADKVAIQTVIRNLVYNGVKFTHKGGEVTISAYTENDNSVVISVSDNGIGMRKIMKDNLFRIDVQTNRAGTDGEPSSGLGLLLCKELIENQGGKIWVESEEGKGSTFYLSIPGFDETLHPVVKTEKI